MAQAGGALTRGLTVLYYLPVVTPWWFEMICIPLIRAAAKEHEVHVMVPPLWSGTGIGPGQVPLLADLPQVYWHVLDGPDHPVLRVDASGQEELFELVCLVAPDIVLCRSADNIAPARFPGVVRYIMEGGAPPLMNAPRSVWLAPDLFEYGMLPDLAEADLALLDELAGDVFDALDMRASVPAREEFLAMHGLPADKRVLGLALDYEHEENFFARHNAHPSNAALIAGVAAELDGDTILAVTQHPLTERYADPHSIDAAVAAAGGRVRVLANPDGTGLLTKALSHHADGFIVSNSKCWSSAVLAGTPLVRLSPCGTADWVRAYRSVAALLADLKHGREQRAHPVATRRWFTFHMLNHVIDSEDETLDAEAIVGRALKPGDPGRWRETLARRIAFRERCRVRAA